MSATDVSKLRTDLEEQRADLQSRLGELVADTDSSPDFDENFADSAQVAAEQGENLTLAANLRDQLDDVQSALSRLDAGTYGRCEVCGKEISEARLEAMPATRYCIEHASGT
jgi:RNA polymerase-binding transcription factor